MRFADSKSVRLPLPRRTSRARLLLPHNAEPEPSPSSPTAGEVIARIPKSGCITRANCARSDAISKLRVSMGGDEQWLAILGAALLLERTSFSDSRWAPYLATLPREESDVVASWPDDRRRFLAGTDIEQALRDERAQARSEWEGHVAKVVRDATSDVDDDGRPGFDDYLAARSVVSSRAFTVDDAVGVGLVPVADMFNHRTGGNHVCVADVDDASAIPAAARSAAGEPSMYVRVVSPANAGDEVFNTYGDLGNAKLLSSYGFAQRIIPQIASRSGCLRCERRQRCEGWRGRRWRRVSRGASAWA